MRLIDADALKSALEMKVYNDYDDLLRTERLIDNAPTLPNPCGKPCAFERPHGEWIVQRLQNGFDDVYCPFCKARPTRSEYGYYLRDNFCPNCGADMRKEGEAK